MTARPGVHAGHPGEYRHCAHVDCVTYRARYTKRWAYERAQGRKRLVDATPVRRHIETLIGAGWSYRAVAGAADTSPTTTHRVGRGLQNTVQGDVARRILAVAGIPKQPTKDADEPFVPKVGTVRRIQALLRMGWRHEDISATSGVLSSVVLGQQGRWVTRTTHDKVAAAFAQLAMTPGPSERTRRRAAKLGYLGPLDWDDIDLDAERARRGSDHAHKDEVDPIVVERVLAGDRLPTTLAEKREITARWLAQGGTQNELARRTGWKSERYIDREAS